MRIWLIVLSSLVLSSTLLLGQASAHDIYSIRLDTERSIYGPGAEVRFFGDVLAAGKAVPDAHLTYIVFGPTGGILTSGTMITSSVGSFQAEFSLPTKLERNVCSYASPHGIYRIVVSLSDDGQLVSAETSVRASFSVPEYEFVNASWTQVLILVGLVVPSLSVGKRLLPSK